MMATTLLLSRTHSQDSESIYKTIFPEKNEEDYEEFEGELMSYDGDCGIDIVKFNSEDLLNEALESGDTVYFGGEELKYSPAFLITDCKVISKDSAAVIFYQFL